MSFFSDMAINPFLVTGLLAGLLASVACGIIGPYVVTRRIVFLCGAIAHMAVGGIGAAIFLRHYLPETFGWCHPMVGAVVAALLSALLIGVVYERVSERMDTLIGAMWAIGMSIGILLLKYTPGYHVELMSFLFGSLVMVSWTQVAVTGGLTVVLLTAHLLLHKRMLALCLDEEQARLQGIGVLRMNVVMLLLVALAVICLIQVVGLILVLALLTLPAATASHHVHRLGPVILVSMVLCAIVTTVPRIVLYETRVSPESAIVLTAGAVYLVSVLVRRRTRRPA